MFGVLAVVCIFYLIYNLLLGIVVMIPLYLVKEKRIVDGKEFLFISLFPSAGLGYWQYNKLAREKTQPGLPRKWYVWKKMNLIHVGYLVSVLLLYYMLIAGLLDGFTDVEDDGNGIVSIFSMTAGLFVGMFLFFVFIVFYLFLALLMLLVPQLTATKIKNNDLQQKQFMRIKELEREVQKVNSEKTTTPSDGFSPH